MALEDAASLANAVALSLKDSSRHPKILAQWQTHTAGMEREDSGVLCQRWDRQETDYE